METALGLLARRPCSEQQIRSALAAKPFDEEMADRVIARLVSRRMLDDPELARSRTRARAAKGIGVERIREELRRLGIDENSIEEAVRDELPDEPQWMEETLRRRTEKRPDMTRAAAYRFLASRGFPEDRIEQAIESVFGAED
jgi:regulatory protein